MAVASLDAAVVPADPLDDLPADAVVAVAMSGGVDSSVAALRCVERGITTWGVTLAMWPGSGEQVRDRGCCSIDSVDDARRVCAKLGISHYTWNLEDDFHASVITDFENEYADGRTPNPCVRCNERIKFGELVSRALAAGATHVATGHYARRGRRGEEWTLHRSVDARKDQSYTLHRLDQVQLGHAVFPLGSLNNKAETRQIAQEAGLVTAKKAESQDLCFIDGSVKVELERRLEGRFRPGDIVDAAGAVVGRHRGLPFYTVGQRSGLGLAPQTSDAEPNFVIRLDAGSNRVVVGHRKDLLRTSLTARDVKWVSGHAPDVGLRVVAQLRAHGDPKPATIAAVGSEGVSLDFDPPVDLVSPGQPVVMLRGDEILGGGVVASSA